YRGRRSVAMRKRGNRRNLFLRWKVARQSEAQSFECGEAVLHSVGACRLTGERRCGLGNWGLVGLKWLRSVALALIVHGHRSTRCCLSRCGKRPFADFAERSKADIQCKEPVAKARRSRHRPL